MRCHICHERDGEYYSCCGDPTDGSCGTGCDHEDGEPTCSACGAEAGWWDEEPEEPAGVAVSQMHTIWYADGQSYSGADALDRLWVDLVTGADDAVRAISWDLRNAALETIDECPSGRGPMGLTPDSARRVILALEVRSA